MWTKWCHLTLSNKFLPNWNFESKRRMRAKMPTATAKKTDLKTMYDWIWAGRTFSCSKKYLCERNITDRSEPGNGTHHPSTCSFLNKHLKFHHNHKQSYVCFKSGTVTLIHLKTYFSLWYFKFVGMKHEWMNKHKEVILINLGRYTEIKWKFT